MPITAKQFELGVDSEIEGWMRKIHQFLASRKEEAFTKAELAQALDAFTKQYKQQRDRGAKLGQAITPSESSLDSAFTAALGKLVEVEAVDSRTIRYEEYYALGDRPLPL